MPECPGTVRQRIRYAKDAEGRQGHVLLYSLLYPHIIHARQSGCAISMHIISFDVSHRYLRRRHLLPVHCPAHITSASSPAHRIQYSAHENPRYQVKTARTAFDGHPDDDDEQARADDG